MEKVTVNCVINRPTESIWGLVRDFGKIGNWHPDITSSLIENSNSESIIRTVMLGNDKALERLIECNDQTFQQTYTFEESSIPVENYIGTIQLTALSERRTQIIWCAEYRCDPIHRNELKQFVENNIFKKGLMGIAEKLDHATCIFSE